MQNSAFACLTLYVDAGSAARNREGIRLKRYMASASGYALCILESKVTLIGKSVVVYPV